ncbi:MAG: methylenetetrahydrofolate reductase, partial [Acidimicrobiia bacterium]
MALAETLRSVRYELVPTASAAPAAQSVPQGGTVTITASPRRGIDTSIDIAVELSRADLRVVPHLAARLVRDRGHLEALLERLAKGGVAEIFVIGGDGEPRGMFTEAMEVIRAIEDSGHRFTIGIAGYPEGHPLVSDEELWAALVAKREHASYLVTQMCFDASALARWIENIRARGVELPVLIGLPGVVAMTRLVPVAARIGVGASIRFLTRHRGLWRRLLTPNYSPTDLLGELAPLLGDSGAGVGGLHLYTFNQVAATEQWRQE